MKEIIFVGIFIVITGMDIYVGKLIHKILKEQGRSVAWLARELHTVRSNVYDIFSRKGIDTELLCRISAILNHNFFRDIADSVDCRLKDRN